MCAALVFRVLGTLQADRDGSPVPLPSRRQRTMLAALLTRAGKTVPADMLIEAAWGERLPDHPKAARQTVLSRLRTALGAGLISAHISGYRLNVPADGVDALRFEALRERAAHVPDAAAAVLLEASWHCGVARRMPSSRTATSPARRRRG
jgi:DNA-binding SARP family transcriptional activator